jgi:hypothetical protein
LGTNLAAAVEVLGDGEVVTTRRGTGIAADPPGSIAAIRQNGEIVIGLFGRLIVIARSMARPTARI